MIQAIIEHFKATPIQYTYETKLIFLKRYNVLWKPTYEGVQYHQVLDKDPTPQTLVGKITVWRRLSLHTTKHWLIGCIT